MNLRFKIDENLPRSHAGCMNAAGFDTDTAEDEGLSGRPDGEVVAAARAVDRIVVTQDLDFADLRSTRVKESVGIVVLRLSEPDFDRVVDRLTRVLQDARVQEWRGQLVIVTDDRVRIRRIDSL